MSADAGDVKTEIAEASRFDPTGTGSQYTCGLTKNILRVLKTPLPFENGVAERSLVVESKVDMRHLPRDSFFAAFQRVIGT